MYKVGDRVKLVSVQSMKYKVLVRRKLKECLRVTQGKLFKTRHTSVAKHQLDIVDVIDYGNGKKGYVGYKPLNRLETHFIIGHCNYPSYSEDSEDHYRWLLYIVQLSHNEKSKPIAIPFEDIKLIDKWVEEGIYVNKFLKNLKHLFD